MTHRTVGRTLAIVVVAGIVGCNGGGSGDGAGETDTDTAGTGGSEESGGVPGDCDVGPGRVGLQRLTRDEYNRTVRDLFGVTSDPADAFPPDSVSGGFDNHAQSLTISPQLAALLLDAAETVAAEAMVDMGGEIVICDPAQNSSCARDTLASLGLRVYRRPPTDTELDDLLALVQFAEDEGDTFEDGIEYALQAMLMAPQFLYRSVPADGDGPLQPGQVLALDDYALASRLSYFLWSSTPDDQLLTRAGEGVLTDPPSLRAEFDRMLTDEKSEALYDSFAQQWLQLGKLQSASPDASAFPEFSEQMRYDMAWETRLLFKNLLARDGSPLEIVNGTRTFVNSDLAAIYGGSVPGSSFELLELDPNQRAGFLTTPAVLTMTSGPEHPNIVKRGVWLAETILCAAPPPPPGGVPPEPEPIAGETERERLERHRLDPSCASCHDLIDPLGFAFENYGALGHWRDDIEGEAVDNLGTLPGGTEFNGVVELAQLLAEDDSFKTCVSSKLMTYALGRAVDPAEHCVIDDIGAQNVTPDSTISDLLWAVVTSDQFQLQEGGE